jgi:hypothetical protein
MKRILIYFGIIIVFTTITFGSSGEVGIVGSINPGNKEIIVNLNSGVNLKMGQLLEIDTGKGKIILEVKFPMMTIAKCTIHGKGKLSSIQADMPVYAYGKSSEKESSSANKETDQRFSDNTQGIIKDNKTGLMWLKDANPARKSMTWDEAHEFIGNLNAAGKDDWRLPTKEEFEYFLKTSPEEIKKSFDNVRVFYWTSTEYALSPGCIWVAGVEDGTVNYSFKTNDNYIWPVRDGKTRVRNSVKSKSGDDKVKNVAEGICEKNNEKFISFSIDEDTIINTSYGVKCRKGKKEKIYKLRYDKFLGTWSD